MNEWWRIQSELGQHLWRMLEKVTQCYPSDTDLKYDHSVIIDEV